MLHKMRQMILLLGLLSFLILLVTGFAPLVTGVHLQGYGLMTHAIFAPVFISCLAILAVMFWPSNTDIGTKVLFWFLLLMSLPLTLSMVLSMFPLFDTDGQVTLLQLHRICTVVFSLALVLEIYMLVRMKATKGLRN